MFEIQEPLYRFCVESVESRPQTTWWIDRHWPFLHVQTEQLQTAVVRPLEVQQPSWIWQRPLLNLPTDARLTIHTREAALAPGAALYIDAWALQGAGHAGTLEVSPHAMRPHILRTGGGRYELELCPALRQAITTLQQ